MRISDWSSDVCSSDLRDLPQNFGGGQNPGIAGGGAQGGNENVGSTSALNLRGLGPDATLTLINGHRVAYDGAIQGVDISAIPLAALDRIEKIGRAHVCTPVPNAPLACLMPPEQQKK